MFVSGFYGCASEEVLRSQIARAGKHTPRLFKLEYVVSSENSRRGVVLRSKFHDDLEFWGWIVKSGN